MGCYIFDDDRGAYVGSVLDVLTLRNGLIEHVTAFFSAAGLGRSEEHDGYVDAVDFADFGLPGEIVE